jgi:hypothetical protein
MGAVAYRERASGVLPMAEAVMRILPAGCRVRTASAKRPSDAEMIITDCVGPSSKVEPTLTAPLAAYL